MAGIPEELMDQIDMDAILKEAEDEGKRALEAETQSPAASPFVARDYIPADPKERTPEQEVYLQERSAGVIESTEFRRRDYIPQGEPEVDQTLEQKTKTALEAAMRRQVGAKDRERESAMHLLNQRTEGEAIALLMDLPPIQREMYLEVEAENQNRAEIFARFGKVPERRLEETVDDMRQIPKDSTLEENITQTPRRGRPRKAKVQEAE